MYGPQVDKAQIFEPDVHIGPGGHPVSDSRSSARRRSAARR